MLVLQVDGRDPVPSCRLMKLFVPCSRMALITAEVVTDVECRIAPEQDPFLACYTSVCQISSKVRECWCCRSLLDASDDPLTKVGNALVKNREVEEDLKRRS